MADFEDVVIEHILRYLNVHVDALARPVLATTIGIDHPITIEVIFKPRPPVEILEILKEDWTKPILQFLTTGQISEEIKEERGFRLKVARYTILDGMLYKRGYSVPLIHCVDSHTTKEMLEEFHEGLVELMNNLTR